MKILIIDNYDSFTFNLYQLLGEILISLKSRKEISDFEIVVKRNNEISLDEIRKLEFDRIIISPGPGSPDDERYFGISKQVILQLGKEIPILGVCLGMQGIAYCFGGKVIRAKLPMHGKISTINHSDSGVFSGIPQDVEVMRYHSLIVDSSTLPECFIVTARVNSAYSDSEEEIMGIKHQTYPIEGVQFHPESFASEAGKTLLQNFVHSKL